MSTFLFFINHETTGIAMGKDARDAFKNLKQECLWIKEYKLDKLLAREAGKIILSMMF